MKLPSGNTLLQFQIGLVLALTLVWWITRPPEEPEPLKPISEFAPSPEIVWGDGQNEIRSSAPMAEPAWMSEIDTSKPECVEMKKEILELAAKGELTDIIYLGDRHKSQEAEQRLRATGDLSGVRER